MAVSAGTHVIKTGDGRDLCVEVAGGRSELTILAHTAPRTAQAVRGMIEDAQARGVRLISYDRPGYGGSSPQPGHRVADGAGDVEAIAAALEIERLAIWGLSGGGPYALACAALLPDLVTAVATVGSVAPWGAAGLDYFAGMGELNVEDIELYVSDPEAAQRKTAQDRDELMLTTPDKLLEDWRTLLSEPDRVALDPDVPPSSSRPLKTLSPASRLWTTASRTWSRGSARLDPSASSLTAPRPLRPPAGECSPHVPRASRYQRAGRHLSIVINRIADIHAGSWPFMTASTSVTHASRNARHCRPHALLGVKTRLSF